MDTKLLEEDLSKSLVLACKSKSVKSLLLNRWIIWLQDVLGEKVVEQLNFVKQQVVVTHARMSKFDSY